MSRSGPIDLLAIDRSGNTVVIELKRDELPRECLAQAIDYASDVASWTVEKLGEICAKYSQKSFEDAFSDAFPDVDLDSVNVNSSQRILTRAQSKRAFVEFDPTYDESRIGYYLSLVSLQLGLKKNDFLRQVVAYEYPRHKWEKDNFSIPERYRGLVQAVLDELMASAPIPAPSTSATGPNG